MKKICLLILGIVCAMNTYASHFSGGELRYEFNGTNYDVYLSVYKICEGGISLSNTASLNIASVSQSYNNNIGMTFLGYDTTHLNCGTTVSKCSNPSSTLPGYITARFKATVTLPAAANDWVLSYNSCCRIISLLNMPAGTMYLVAKIDNTAAINSNPLLASSPSYYMLVSTNTVIPLQAIDPEGDNIVYDLVAPLETGGIPVTYNTGYSATSPFGTSGTATINTTNKTLTLNCSVSGTYSIGLRMREYRNTVLVGEHFREFTVAVLPGTGTGQTIPVPATTTNFTYYTCPGQSNSITLNFLDPTSTDSVYLTVMPPTISGWTFSSSVTNGTPSASTTITWTTPTGLNPATLPFFYIKVRARDNGCPKAIADYAVVVRTRQCNADSVWPGDANGDFTVNIYDPLAIAIAAGQTGPTRPGATTTWTAQACTNWTGVFVTNNTNMKHADCNGDGTVNTTDLGAVTANYTLSHPKPGKNKPTGANDLYFDMSNVYLTAGSDVSIPVKFGSASQTISNVYGLATRVLINGLPLTTTPTIAYTGSWLAGSNPVNFVHGINTTAVDWVQGRTNQQNVSGQGLIGTLNFTVPANATVGSTVTFSFENTVVIDKDGMENYDVNNVDGTGLVLQPESVSSIAGNILSVAISPNPSGDAAYLNIVLEQAGKLQLAVRDITGKIVWTTNGDYSSGQQQIALPAAQLSAGMYMVQLFADNGQPTSVLKWVKQ